MDYRWWVFIHLAGVLAFLAAHGVSITVAFIVRGSRDREQIRSLLQLSGSTIIAVYLSLLVLLTGGIGAGITGKWFGSQWIWISLYILVGITLLMGGMARPYYAKIKESLELRPSGAPRVSDEDLVERLRSPIPLILAGVGVGGLAAILYLMIFKPF